MTEPQITLHGVGFKVNGAGDLNGTVVVKADGEHLGVEHAGNYSRGAVAELHAKLVKAGINTDVADSLIQTHLAALRSNAEAFEAAPTEDIEPPPYATPYSDMGMAERLVKANVDGIRHVAEWGDDWSKYDSKRWEKGCRGGVIERAKKTVRDLYHDAADIEDAALRDDLLGFAKKSQAAPRIQAMVKLAESDPLISIRSTDLDTALWSLNVANGTLDLENARLLPHDPKDLITKLAPVEYDPRATSPIFDTFIHKIMGGNPALVDYLQRVLGYCLTGDVSEQSLWIFHGSGANGKSTLMNTIYRVMGDYASQPSIDTFMSHKNKPQTQPELMDLAGVRLAVSSELEPGARLSEDLVKKMTGGERIRGRRLYEQPWDYMPAFKPIFVVNSLPTVRGQDHAIWRRVHRVPFSVQIPPEEQDKRLPGKLWAEAPGILAWLVRGCMEVQADGLEPPAIVDQATASYREDQDILAPWMLAAGIQVRTDLWAESKSLYSSYTTWAEANKVRAVSLTAFGSILAEKGFDKSVIERKTVRLGLGFDDKL